MAYKAGNIIKPPKGLKIKTHLCTGLCIITNVLKNHTLQNIQSHADFVTTKNEELFMNLLM